MMEKGSILIDLPGEGDCSPLSSQFSQDVKLKADVLCIVSPINDIESCQTVQGLLESAGLNRKVILVPTQVDNMEPFQYVAQEEQAKDQQISELKKNAVRY